MRRIPPKNRYAWLSFSLAQQCQVPTLSSFSTVDWRIDFILKLSLFSLICLFQGGYNLSSVEESMCACTSSLLGDPCPRLDGPVTPCDR